jgi:Protein of unknown function (DUF3995)
MTAISVFLSVITLALAGVHILWAIGFWWPIRIEELLVRTVVGYRGATRMPGPIPCGLVAVALIFAANFPWFPHGALRTSGLWLCAAVFLIRGGLAYMPFWRAMTPQKPFSTLDRTRYGPLCLLLGAGYLTLAFGASS